MSFRHVLLAGLLVSASAMPGISYASHKSHQSKASKHSRVLNSKHKKHHAAIQHFEQLVPNLMAVNAKKTRPLSTQYDPTIPKMKEIRDLVAHPAVDVIMVLKGDKVLFEYYGNGLTSTSLHSCQSTTKTLLNLLAGAAIKNGELNLNSEIDEYVSEVGSDFRGQTVSNILATNVNQSFDNEETSPGWLPSKFTPMTRRQFITTLNVDHSLRHFYDSPNTEMGAWIVESATGVPTEVAIRKIMHAIGGENTVYIATDKSGLPIVMGGLVMTARDFARYGILLMTGGQGANGKLVGGGPSFVQSTMKNATVTLGKKGWYYKNSAYVSTYGIGHAGWGGQWLWTDPKSQTVIVVFSGLRSKKPVDPKYSQQLIDATVALVDHNRAPAKHKVKHHKKHV